MRLHRHERVLREVPDGTEGCGGGANLRVPEGRVVREEVVHRYNVVNRVHGRRRVVDCAAARRDGALS